MFYCKIKFGINGMAYFKLKNSGSSNVNFSTGTPSPI